LIHEPKEIVDRIVRDMFVVLKPLGYGKSGTLFRCFRSDVTLMVQLQKDRSSTEESLRFTLNLAIAVNDLVRYNLVPPKLLKQVSVADAHAQWRIGFLSPEYRDMWWEVTATTDADELSAGVVGSLSKYGLPVLERYASREAILTAWRSGDCLSLAQREVKRFLSVCQQCARAGPTSAPAPWPDPAGLSVTPLPGWNLRKRAESVVLSKGSACCALSAHPVETLQSLRDTLEVDGTGEKLSIDPDISFGPVRGTRHSWSSPDGHHLRSVQYLLQVPGGHVIVFLMPMAHSAVDQDTIRREMESMLGTITVP
jgi:hypothetical protein